MILPKYSIGIGDRFGRQGRAQLAAVLKARQQGVAVTPVWNKSNREHSIIGTSPADVRSEADAAAAGVDFPIKYFVDADHINLSTVEAFIGPSDFFTLDVADWIGRAAAPKDDDAFVEGHSRFIGALTIPGIDEILDITEQRLRSIAVRYLLAVQEAGKLYRHIEAAKGRDNFITEVSMDETAEPQGPVELLFILAAVAQQGIPAQTVAPRFSGRFNKGVDYVGDMARFKREFDEDMAVLAFAAVEFDLPRNLKLSIHSGSDKFSIYRPMRTSMKKFDAGLHLKTAGTTWLEELIGLACAGGDGLALVKEVYAKAQARLDELTGPYANVIDIHKDRLPSPEAVNQWDSETFVRTLRHDPSCEQYDPNVRQLLHGGYKIAAEMGPRYYEALQRHEHSIAPNVTGNLYDRHIRPLFIGT